MTDNELLDLLSKIIPRIILKTKTQLPHEILSTCRAIILLLLPRWATIPPLPKLTFDTTSCSNCNTQKAAFIQRIANDSFTDQSWVFSVPTLDSIIGSHGSITLELGQPNNNGTGQSSTIDVTFQPFYFEMDQEVDYVWMGKSIDNKHSLMLAGNAGMMSGFVFGETQNWEILPVKSGYSIIRSKDESFNPPAGCGLDSLSATIDSIEYNANVIDLCEDNTECISTVDILVLVPQDVQQWYGDEFDPTPIGALAAGLHLLLGHYTFLFATFESGYENLRIRVSFRAVDYPYGPFSVIDEVYFTLPQFTANNNLRNQYRADMVVLSTTQTFGNEFTFGAANVGELQSDNAWEAPCFDCAYAISNINFMSTPRWTLAHEIAHLFSGRHSRDRDDFDVCGHGFMFSNEIGPNRTALATLTNNDQDNGESRALRFSNPDVDFEGFATGTVDDNNALVINNSACLIEDYYASPFLGVQIGNLSGQVLCGLSGNVNSKNLTAEVIQPAFGLPGTPPYTYEWRWNDNGIFNSGNPGVVIGTASSITINTAYDCPSFFVRLKITSSDGESATSTMTINSTLCSDCNGENSSESATGIEETYFKSVTETQLLKIYPNPAKGQLIVSGANPNDLIEIFNLQGQKILVYKIANQGKVTISINDLKTGTYLLRRVSEVTNDFVKFVKQ
ncbi:hypothetical protein CEQ90_17455 [Lewinellaceae bacterium SD302]|nr:hypothetical protein CEQ90_17455 [Lewinellaceae bacterium SD302]